MSMTSVQLDVVVATWEGETLQGVMQELTEGTHVVAHVADPHGPAGGNPVVEFTGDTQELITVIKRYDGPDNQSAFYDLLVGLGIAVVEVAIPLDPGFKAIGGEAGRRIGEQEILEGIVKWAREIIEDPRPVAVKIHRLASLSETDEEAHHAYYG